MNIEHIGLNVEDPAAMARWYCEHLGMKVIRQLHAENFFIADDSGNGVIEIYRNTTADIPDYRKVEPLVLHIAFISKDVHADAARLTAAGAEMAGEVKTTPDGDVMGFVKDPWGVTVQLVQRKQGFQGDTP